MELRQVEPLFVLLSLLALIACVASFVPAAAQAPAAVPASSKAAEADTLGLRPTPTTGVAPASLERYEETAWPAGCVTRDGESQVYLNVEDGYCLRYPAGFRLGEVLPGIANFYGPPRAPGIEPLLAGLVIRVEDLDGQGALAEVAEQYVQEQQRVGWLSPACTRSSTTLGGQPAVLLVGPGEYTLHILVAVYEGRRYTLSFWPDPEQFPLIAEDVDVLRRTVVASFSFLSESISPLEPSADQQSSVLPR